MGHSTQARTLFKAALLAGATFAAAEACAGDTAPLDGISFYGVVDVGVSYDTHGVPPSSGTATLGSNYIIGKNSGRSIVEMIQSGMTQSGWGIKGADRIGGDWTGIFKLEGAFNPLSGDTTDALRTIVNQNGVPQAQQAAYSDSSLAGQLFGRAAYVGMSHPDYGTLMFGRNQTLESDAISAYDPTGRANAFSLIGSSGTTAGAGRTEAARWDNSVKYLAGYGVARLGAMYQFGGTLGRNDTGFGADLGADYAGFSVDAIYTVKKDMVATSPLTAAQVKSAAAAGFNPQNSFSATVSDNVAYGLNAKYAMDKMTYYAGYEHIRYGNARSPLAVGFINIGNYVASVVSNSAAQGQLLQVVWAGARYQVTQRLETMVAWNHYDQNSFKGNGCSDNSASSCSGTQDIASLILDYHFTKNFDLYGGAMYSKVLNGLASGFYHNNNIDPTVGLRYSW